MNMVRGLKLDEIKRWAKTNLQAGSLIISDGLACFRALKEATADISV
jgi:hypothetical protein